MNFPRQILLVHEMKERRQSLKETLKLSSYEVLEACDIAEAETVLQNESVALVIVSMSLPRNSSLNLISLVRSTSAKVPLLTVTEKRRFAAILECSKVGGVGFITYPFNHEYIRKTVRDTLERAETQLRVEDGQPVHFANRYFAGYHFKGVLGKGSMGIVYLAEKIDSGVAKPYAIKVLQQSVGQTEEQKRELLERFLREAEAASGIEHPNIVRIIDFGIAEEQLTPYIVMDFIAGRSLRHFVGKSGLSHKKKAMIIRQVAYALTAIHSHGICHRDIKPENIMIDRKLNIKVADFGIARLPNSDLTQAVKILGTPAYMAPEAFSSARVGSLADIFSLGVVAYELFLGKKPFYSESINGYRHKILNERPVEPRKIDHLFPLKLQCTLAKLLKKGAENRFTSAAEVVKALDQYLERISEKGENRVVDLLEDCDDSGPLNQVEAGEQGDPEIDWK